MIEENFVTLLSFLSTPDESDDRHPYHSRRIPGQKKIHFAFISSVDLLECALSSCSTLYSSPPILSTHYAFSSISSSALKSLSPWHFSIWINRVSCHIAGSAL